MVNHYTKDWFTSKYPNADTSKFLFDKVSINESEYDYNIYFINNSTFSSYIDITTDEFKNNPQFTKYLSQDGKHLSSESFYPKIWLGKGDIQPLQKGTQHAGTWNKWIGKTTGVHTQRHGEKG